MTWAIIALLQIIAGASVPSGQCKSTATTIQMEQCLKKELDVEEQRLTRVEKTVHDDLSAPNRSLFTTAAETWRTYRNQECNAVYAESADGSIAATALLGCKIELTKSRRSLLGRIYMIEK